MQGKYNWAALLMGDPIPPEGVQFKADRIKVVQTLPRRAQFARGWDLASTRKQRQKDDPDYTAGVKVGWHDGDIYIADVRRGQWSAGERDETIVDCARFDGADVELWIEAVGGYKDAQHYIGERLYHTQRVHVFTPQDSKDVRATYVERKIEFNQVFMLDAPWNRAFIEEMRTFPNGRHDDQVDAFVLAVDALKKVAERQVLKDREDAPSPLWRKAERAAVREAGMRAGAKVPTGARYLGQRARLGSAPACNPSPRSQGAICVGLLSQGERGDANENWKKEKCNVIHLVGSKRGRQKARWEKAVPAAIRARPAVGIS